MEEGETKQRRIKRLPSAEFLNWVSLRMQEKEKRNRASPGTDTFSKKVKKSEGGGENRQAAVDQKNQQLESNEKKILEKRQGGNRAATQKQTRKQAERGTRTKGPRPNDQKAPPGQPKSEDILL